MTHANTANRQIRKRALPCGSTAVWQQALQAQPAREEVFTTIGEQPCGQSTDPPSARSSGSPSVVPSMSSCNPS